LHYELINLPRVIARWQAKNQRRSLKDRERGWAGNTALPPEKIKELFDRIKSQATDVRRSPIPAYQSTRQGQIVEIMRYWLRNGKRGW
jgi:hypothetical protein